MLREASSPESLADELRAERYEVWGPNKFGAISYRIPGCRENSATPLSKEVQRRAIAYGAMKVEPSLDASKTSVRWPADQERVSLDFISYHPDDDTFSGWSGRPTPEWTQR